MTSASHINAVFCKPAGQARAYGDYLHGTFSWEFTRGVSVVLDSDEEHTSMKSLAVSQEGTVHQSPNINPKWTDLINTLHAWTLQHVRSQGEKQ